MQLFFLKIFLLSHNLPPHNNQMITSSQSLKTILIPFCHYYLSTGRLHVHYLPLQLLSDLETVRHHQLQLEFMTPLHLVLGQNPL